MEESKGPNRNPGRREPDRSREKEPNTPEAERGRNADPGRSESDDGTDPRSLEARRENATQRRHEFAQSSVEDCRNYLRTGGCGYGRRCRYNHPPMSNQMVQTSPYPVRPQLPQINQIRHETVQGSPFPVRPGVQDCEYYLRTGLCRYGSDCHFNHPPNSVAPVRPKRVIQRNCKFFLRGNCKNGSDCVYLHPNDTAPMRQAATASSSMAAKRAGELDPRERFFQGVRDNIVAGYKRIRFEQGEGNIGWQRVESEEIVQEHRERQNSWRRQAQDNTQRQNTKRSPRRETEESEEERRMKEQADMERQVREAKEIAQEQLRIDTERREARLLIEQIQPTVSSDNVDQIRESLSDIGIERKEGDGF